VFIVTSGTAFEVEGLVFPPTSMYR